MGVIGTKREVQKQILIGENMITKKEIEALSTEILTQKIIEGKVKFNDEWKVVIKRLIDRKYRFTQQELTALSKESDMLFFGSPIHNLAAYGYMFTVDELEYIKNPVNKFGMSVAYFMAQNKFSFTLEQIMRFEKSDKDRQSLAFLMAGNHHVFSIDEIARLNSLANHHGWDIAHEMAKSGHIFSKDEILALGNLPDHRGLTIADIMVTYGYQFTKDEENELGIDRANFAYNAYASYNIRKYFKTAPPDPKICPKCKRKLVCTSLENPSKFVGNALNDCIMPQHDFTRLFNCKGCNFWCIREAWSDNEIPRDDDGLLVGIPKKKVSSDDDTSRPWEKALVDENPYYHDLQMTKDIHKMLS